MRLVNKNCTKGLCAEYERMVLNDEKPVCCNGCGFEVNEVERRKKVPFTRDKNGRLRKLVGRLAD